MRIDGDNHIIVRNLPLIFWTTYHVSKVESPKETQAAKNSNGSLPQRLRITPIFHPGYVYHVTRGVHLASIRRYGLVAQDKSEYNNSSKRNWFSQNLSLAYKLYGIDIVYSRYRLMPILGGSRFAENYFQGIAVLRCRPPYLFSIDYALDLELSLVGERKVGPQAMELFIDGKWIPLNRVKLKQTLWPVLYKLTRFLRIKP